MQTQLRICQEEIEDQKTNLFKEREASAHSENQQKLLIAQLAELEAEFQKSQEECSQQISEVLPTKMIHHCPLGGLQPFEGVAIFVSTWPICGIIAK